MLPIVHVQSTEQAIYYVSLAVAAGAQGVWLINSGGAGGESAEGSRQVQRTSLKKGSTSEHIEGQAQLSALAECFQAVRDMFQDFWVGVCVPQLNAARVFLWVEKNCVTADAVWLDELQCRPADVCWEMLGEGDYALRFAVRLQKWLDLDDILQLQAVHNARRRCCWLGLVFGTVASRGQERCHHEQDAQNMSDACTSLLGHWAYLAGRVCDVIVTTGPEDGGACPASKLQALAVARPLACLGPLHGGRAACGDGAGAEILMLDTSEFADKGPEHLKVVLEHWVQFGQLPSDEVEECKSEMKRDSVNTVLLAEQDGDSGADVAAPV